MGTSSSRITEQRSSSSSNADTLNHQQKYSCCCCCIYNSTSTRAHNFAQFLCVHITCTHSFTHQHNLYYRLRYERHRMCFAGTFIPFYFFALLCFTLLRFTLVCKFWCCKLCYVCSALASFAISWILEQFSFLFSCFL